ncbi:MAG: M23 family metallopeptidase [Pseudomonadota bacterium]|nr:M23 family metallopeptidase [Pseudomonadota bacterium]
MARSTVLIVTSGRTRSLEVDSRLLASLRPLLLGLGTTSVVLGAGLAALAVQHLATRSDAHAARQASQSEIDTLRREVTDLKNFTSAEINTKLAALKKSEQMIGDLQNYLQSRGVNVKPVSAEPPKGQPNPAAGGPSGTTASAHVARPVPYTGSFARDAGNLLEVLQSIPLGLPHEGPLSSGFGNRANPFTGRGSESHGGLDFKGNTGDPIQSTASGTVTFAGWQGGYGNLVEVTHGHGYRTLYAHLSRIDVKKGQKISGGHVVGQLGSTGRSTGPHLHYEVQLRGERLSPEQFLSLDTLGAL